MALAAAAITKAASGRSPAACLQGVGEELAEAVRPAALRHLIFPAGNCDPVGVIGGGVLIHVAARALQLPISPPLEEVDALTRSCAESAGVAGDFFSGPLDVGNAPVQRLYQFLQRTQLIHTVVAECRVRARTSAPSASTTVSPDAHRSIVTRSC